jgi:hypothetical protein
MKKSFLLFILLAASLFGYSQIAGTGSFDVVEYRPAPGQHINIESIGTTDAATELARDSSTLVSLGSFGGFVILGFKGNCLNHPDNPYGIDFTVFGNAFTGSSEPGVIWVMKDENKNGWPDDVWYEIAGSHYFHSGTVRDYKVTYVKTASRDVSWYDNNNGSGIIKANEFNLQDYYPSPEYFPDYPQDSVTFSGTLLSSSVDSSNVAEIKTIPPAFGYADCRPMRREVNLNLPDNPYTQSVEGAGGDPVDISWAVDNDGNYVDLDYVNFVKIVSGNMTSAGWLGEISTDISWIEDVNPDAGISGKENLLVVYPHPDRVIAGRKMQIQSCWFEKGRKVAREINYSSDNEGILTIDNAGLIRAGETGSATISISVNDTTYTSIINVVVPDSIDIKFDNAVIYPGDTVQLSAMVFDNLGGPLDLPVNYESSDSLVGKVIKSDNRYFFCALKPGETVLKGFTDDFSVAHFVTISVRSADNKLKVYMSVKTENENLLPFQWVEIRDTDLNSAVKDRNHDYAGLEKLTLFHALVAGLQKAESGFAFRDDAHAGGNLYLYSVENDDIFTYGWGGKTDPEAFARAWIVRLNSKNYLNSFDKIEISDGDTVDLYNIYNITSPWQYRRLLVSEDSVSEHQEIEVFLEKTECKYENGNIIESPFAPVILGEIDAGTILYTGDSGKAVISVGSDLPLTVSSGNSAVLIVKRVTTGITKSYGLSENFSVYPNPFYDELTVRGKGRGGFTIILSDQAGRIIINKTSSSSLCNLNTDGFVSGSYILVVITENGLETFKLIRK